MANTTALSREGVGAFVMGLNLYEWTDTSTDVVPPRPDSPPAVDDIASLATLLIHRCDLTVANDDCQELCHHALMSGLSMHSLAHSSKLVALFAEAMDSCSRSFPPLTTRKMHPRKDIAVVGSF